MIIYLLRNKQNGKCYVGKTTRTLKARWHEHKREARNGRRDTPLYRAIREVSIDNFEAVLLKETDSHERLDEFEREFIAAFKSAADGYNADGHSRGGHYMKHRTTFAPKTREHKQAIAESMRSYFAKRKKEAA